MEEFCSLILAAGKGKRMKSEQPKVLVEVLFKPMIKWVIDSLMASDIFDIGVVTGYKHEILEEYLSALPNNFEVFEQKEQKGTAHAVLVAMEFLEKRRKKDILIMSGDSPFCDSVTIKNAYSIHKKSDNSATIISATLKDPFGYGRILRKNGKIEAIVEQKDADEQTMRLTEVNSGVYWFKVDSLISVLPLIENNNHQNEYYLPDAIGLLLSRGEKIGTYTSPEEYVVLGANDQNQLAELNEIARKKILTKWIKQGTKILNEDNIIIGPDVIIEKDCTILPGTVLKGKTLLKKHSKIGPGVCVSDCSITIV
jgi:bifunctional UDP-N-acetylglucosamine pyrophosphorylase/glucosamine-1-phosphate N-acetyltransferase